MGLQILLPLLCCLWVCFSVKGLMMKELKGFYHIVGRVSMKGS